MSRWYSANVLQSVPGGRRLWRFSTKGGRFVFDGDKTLSLQEPAPPASVGKNWQSLIRPKLNVAWLPADKVFFRAVQLPGADAAEITAMVELQLEKLSPLPVTHIVWSLHLMPKPEGKSDVLQTVIVVIAARAYVEEFLGEIQAQGFLADRIESPGLDQLLSVKMNEDGLWIFPGAAGEPALLAWHYGGAIQNLTLLPLPDGPERGAQLKAHVEQIAWAGELEGWLTGPPRIHLVAQPAVAGAWTPLLSQLAEKGVDIIPPPTPEALAAGSAQRTGNNGATTNLLPAEYGTRYHQQLVDRLWMRAVMTLVGVYIFGVLVYFGFLYGSERTYKKAQQELAAVGVQYTKAMEDELKLSLVTENQNLKYAALDCWKAVAENLPASMNLEHFYFNGVRVDLDGFSDQQDDVYAFHDGLSQAQNAAQTVLLFSDNGVKINSMRAQGNQGNKTAWSFTCTLRTSEKK